MENSARLDPGLMANQFDIITCRNEKPLALYLRQREELGIQACAYCNGCRIHHNTETDTAEAFCSVTVTFTTPDGMGHPLEGPRLTQVVPDIELSFPAEVPARLRQSDAEIYPLGQDSPTEQVA